MMCFLVIWRKDSEILLRMKRGAVVEDFFSPGIRTHITQLNWWYWHWKRVTMYTSSPAIEIFLSPKSSGCWILSPFSLHSEWSYLFFLHIVFVFYYSHFLIWKLPCISGIDSSSKSTLTKQCQCLKVVDFCICLQKED